MRSKKLLCALIFLTIAGDAYCKLPLAKSSAPPPAPTPRHTEPPEAKLQQGASSPSVKDLPAQAPSEATPTQDCPKSENSISLNTLKALTADQQSITVTPKKIEKEINGKKVLVDDYEHLDILIPPFISNCLDLKVDARKVGNDVVIEFTNKYDFKPASAYQGLTGDEKLDKCLTKDVQKEPAEIDDQGNPVYTTKKITQTINGVDEFLPDLTKAKQDFEVTVKDIGSDKFDGAKDINVLVSTAIVKDGQIHYPAYNSLITRKNCEYREMASPEGIKLFNRSKYVNSQKQVVDCDGGPCRQEFINSLEELQRSSLANVNDLIETMKKTRDELTNNDSKREEKKLQEIAKELGSITDEQKLREKLREYVSVLSDYERNYQEIRLTDLRKAYSKLDKGEGNKEEIQKKIKELKSAIGEISKSVYGADLAKRKAEELGLKDDGVFIVKMHLTSAYYSDMQNMAKKAVLKPDQAQTRLDNEMAKYEERAREKLEIYESKSGLAEHSNKYNKQGHGIMSERNRVVERYRETEMGYQKACQPKAFNFSMNGQPNMTNPQKCMRGHQGRQQRYSRLMRATSQIESRANRKFKIAEVLGQHEEENHRRLAAEYEASNGDILDNSTVFDYSDEFSNTDASGMGMFQMNGQQPFSPMMQPYGYGGAPGYQQQPMFPQQQQSAYPPMQYNNYMPMR
jgi:hypothetical protein